MPMTSKATWLTASGITGLTLPGMIELPGWRGGRLISLMPVRGPLESRRRSLQIFDSLTAVRLSMPENSTKAPMSEVASIRSAAGTTGWPLMAARRSTASFW
ncbi:hypothetical protein D9M68_844080 [compost metagenome]